VSVGEGGEEEMERKKRIIVGREKIIP